MHLTLHIEAIMRPNDCHNNNKVNLLSVNANHDYARYSRQLILPEFGTEGQSTLENSSVSVVGCGATGSTILNLLARAGIGELTIIDRDFVELTNLQRQVLFDEGDLEQPKALAAADKVRRANSDVKIHDVIKDLNPNNAEAILGHPDLIVDGTDNMETRFLVNDVSAKHEIPWVYCGAVGTHGMVMPIVPPAAPCLRCFIPNIPPQGVLQTCDLAGVLNTIPAIMASIATTEALRILLGKSAHIDSQLIIYDVWEQSFQKMKVAKDPSCRCCAQSRFEFLDAKKGDKITALCGRDAVQITPARDDTIKLSQLADNLERIGIVKHNEYTLLFKDPHTDYELTLFRDGRAIIKGTRDLEAAKSIYARYVAK
jgi:molybdopterin/thiamine biosynthesis adenylyltransferase